MDAIILAAGKGTRLRPHTNTVPKPLLPVQGRPILDWIIGAMPPVERLVVVVNYLAGQIEDYLRTQRHVRNWTTVTQAEPRGTEGALERIVEKQKGLPAPQLANIGGYVFPKRVFDLTLPLSPRGEYEITDAVAQLAVGGGFRVVEASYWLPIGNVEQWEAAQTADVTAVR